MYYYLPGETSGFTIPSQNSETSIVATTSSITESSNGTKIVATTTVNAHIYSIEGNMITLDYFDPLSGEKAVDAKIADGRCTREEANKNDCLPNGRYDRNVNQKLRTFTLSPGVKITTATAFDKNERGVIAISIQELKSQFVGLPYQITLNAKGEVVIIKEMYRP